MLLFLSLVTMSGCLVALMALATSLRRFGQSRSRFRLQGFVRERFREYRKTLESRESGRTAASGLELQLVPVPVPVPATRRPTADTGRIRPFLS